MVVHRVNTVYKIRRKSDGLFYSRKRPYTRPSELIFSKRGKTWTRLNDARLAKNIWEERLSDCEIVEYEIKEIRVVT